MNWLSKDLANISPKQRVLYALLGLTVYMTLVSFLRFQRQRKLQKEYPYPTRESMSKMTDHDAWAIQKQIMQMEFPSTVVKSLQFALFRVRNFLPAHISNQSNFAADIWNPNYIDTIAEDIPILRLSHLIQALRRHRCFDRRIHGL